MENTSNTITTVGRFASPPVLANTSFGTDLYTSTLEIERLSGAIDELAIILPHTLLDSLPYQLSQPVQVRGQIRSYNIVQDGAVHLLVTLFAQQIDVADRANDTVNKAEIFGTICKRPIYRITPFGREICDVMVAVNRAYGKSDYIPCIAWGRNARLVSTMNVGDKVVFSGRLQSRRYHKQLDDGSLKARIVYELSVARVEQPTMVYPRFKGGETV